MPSGQNQAIGRAVTPRGHCDDRASGTSAARPRSTRHRNRSVPSRRQHLAPRGSLVAQAARFRPKRSGPDPFGVRDGPPDLTRRPEHVRLDVSCHGASAVGGPWPRSTLATTGSRSVGCRSRRQDRHAMPRHGPHRRFAGRPSDTCLRRPLTVPIPFPPARRAEIAPRRVRRRWPAGGQRERPPECRWP